MSKKSFFDKVQYKYLFFLTLVFLVASISLILGLNYPKVFSSLKQSVIVRFATREIKAEEFKKMLTNKDFYLINVHTPYDGEIEKTDSFINYDEMMVNAARLPKDKNQKIIIYCKSGRMSSQALKTLKSMGYINTAELKGGMEAYNRSGGKILNLSGLPKEVLPEEGFELPFSLGDLGSRLISLGVIDKGRFSEAGSLRPENLKIKSANSRFVVNILWAIGLAQKSVVYSEGPMGKKYKNEVGNFASTGGWTLSRGNAVNYLNKFNLLNLSADQDRRVGEIAKNVYRPCCGNSTWFPDCNHGMAALAAIELMVKNNLSDEEIYKNILKLNSFWFPDTYLTTATYFARQGVSWKDVDAKKILGKGFSSAQGAGEIYKKVGSLPYDTNGTGGGCGV